MVVHLGLSVGEVGRHPPFPVKCTVGENQEGLILFPAVGELRFALSSIFFIFMGKRVIPRLFSSSLQEYEARQAHAVWCKLGQGS